MKFEFVKRFETAMVAVTFAQCDHHDYAMMVMADAKKESRQTAEQQRIKPQVETRARMQL